MRCSFGFAGHCYDSQTGQPPRGLQFILGTNSTPAYVDTIVMANLVQFSCLVLFMLQIFDWTNWMVSVQKFSVELYFILLFLTFNPTSYITIGFCILGIFPAESHTWCLDSQTSSGKVVRFISHNQVSSALLVLDWCDKLSRTWHNVSVLFACYQIFVKSTLVCLKILYNILISPQFYHTDWIKFWIIICCVSLISSSHEYTDSPSDSPEVITVVDSFKSKIVKIRVRNCNCHLVKDTKKVSLNYR